LCFVCWKGLLCFFHLLVFVASSSTDFLNRWFMYPNSHDH
jgi:hypothetical protein